MTNLFIDDEKYSKTTKRWNNHFLPITYSSPQNNVYPADVYYDRGKLKIFSIVTINPSQPKPKRNVYGEFSPNHSLPNRLEKK